MPKIARELSALEVRRLTQPGCHPVGGVAGLLLRVKPSGARSWILRYSTGETTISKQGKPFARRRDVGLGAYPDIPLQQAREKARRKRELIEQGVDPVAARRAAKAGRIREKARQKTFEQCAREYHATQAPGFSSDKHAQDWINSLQTHAFPLIGDALVSDIDVGEVLEVLTPMWTTRTETATRVRQRLEAVLSYARAKGYREGENPAAWSGRLEHTLPKPSKVRAKRKQPALPWERIPEFMAALRDKGGMAARALEFQVLTATRPGAVRLAPWSEIDMDRALWTVPEGRAGAKNPGRRHVVPLSAPALKVIKPLEGGGKFVFPAQRGGQLSDMAFNKVMKDMHETSIKSGGAGWFDPVYSAVATAHGMRSAFKDWARNRTRFPDEVSELALWHVNSDTTRSAYARDELLGPRTELMTAWAEFCAGQANG